MLKMGPILQFRGIDAGFFRTSMLVVLDANDPSPQINTVLPAKSSFICNQISSLPLSNPIYDVWRIDISTIMAPVATEIFYTVCNIEGSYCIPAINESPKMAYVSCNGFSELKLMKSVNIKNDRWIDLYETHTHSPYHLLLMGGDQIYTDSMWESVETLKSWLHLPKQERLNAEWTQEHFEQIDQHFFSVYMESWSQLELKNVFRSIPSIMMWDDHDIMDGWGSYPEDEHNCPVFQGIFSVANSYFRVFQQQLSLGERHPAQISNQSAYSMGFRQLGEVSILVLDLRFERKPNPSTIVSLASWDAIYNWLDGDTKGGHLILISSIPVAYLDLNSVERLLGILPGQQELEDDLRDHWRSPPHQKERLRLIYRLFRYSEQKNKRVTIVSGDVHVGAASVIESTKVKILGECSAINQLVSTGVVHPTPPSLVSSILESLGDKPEHVDHGITSYMLPIAGKGRYLITSRNWLALEPDLQGHMWANWHAEDTQYLITKVIHSLSNVSE